LIRESGRSGGGISCLPVSEKLTDRAGGGLAGVNSLAGGDIWLLAALGDPKYGARDESEGVNGLI
jgi:hypothetical protein